MSDLTTTPPSRKHRSHQGNPLVKAALIAGGGLAVCGIIAIFAGQSWLESYIKSTEFRQRVENGIGRNLNADVQLAPFKREGVAVFSDFLDSDAKPGAPFKQLKIRSLRADLDLSALWHRAWRVDFMNIQQMDLNLDAPKRPATESEAPPAPVQNLSWLARFLPNHTEFGTLKVEKAYIQKGALDAQHVRLTASQTNNDWEILAEGGELRLPKVPTLEINSAKLVLHQKNVILRNSKFHFKKGGEVSVTGEVSEAAGTDLHAHLENVNIDPFLSTWWQARLKGTVQGDLHYTQTPGANPTPELDGTIQLNGGKLEALPILSQLDTFLGNPRFRSVPLKTASARIVITPERTIVRNLDLDGDGLIRIQGNLVIEGEKLQGLVQLGLSPSLTQWLPGVRSNIFTDKRDGYVWTSVNLSGSVNNPTEDLTAKLLEAGKDAVIDTIKNVLPANTPVPPALPNAAKGVIDTLKSVIPPR